MDDRFPRIAAVGVELEGLWTEYRRIRISSPMHGDGSVHVEERRAGDRNGEISSPVIKSWSALEKWMVLHYPSRVNQTCGLHMHVSTVGAARVVDAYTGRYTTSPGPLLYQALMDRKFFDLIYKRADRFCNRVREEDPDASSWLSTRLAGRNQYCEKAFRADQQALLTCRDSPRYSGLNYCWSLHGTLEFRLLPMFRKAETALTALEMLARTTDRYLRMMQTAPPQVFEETVSEETEPLEISLTGEC